MPRISNFVEKLETRISNKLGKFTSRHKGNFIKYIPLIIIAWYFYGMFVNSIRLGIQSTFNTTGDEIGSVWVANPLRNFTAIFTPAGLTVTAICVLLTCLILKKGYIFFSGYKFTKDPRGFDILPDATHGSSGFMTLKEMHATLNIEDIETADDTIIGKRKEHPGDEDKYAQYLTVRKDIGLTDHTLVFGATGAGKSRGYVLPFILQAAKRGDSIIIVDPKAEIYKKTSEHLRQNGYTVKVFNLLDPENTDGWNCFADIELDPGLVDSIAEVIIKNTSNESERRDFWENAERSLLQALMHFVASQKIPGTDRLLPIEQRSLGAIYRMLSDESFDNLNRYIDDLPKGHPAKKPYGLFKKSDKRIWGNIAIGLGNRLSVFQNEQLDRLTSYNDIDLTLPGRKPCAYFCVISAQDSQYEFLSSLFFSCLSTRLTDYARRKGTNGMLPVRVNLLLEEFCNIGKLVDFKKQLAVLRGYNVFCQLIVQSVPGLADRYEKKEWEEIISHCDTTICLGVNDLMTAQYISDKCGTITIRVDNNQMPLMPLFSPIYHSTRPYSQTRSSTQRALMMPDEVLRMDNKKCIVILRGQKPLMLDKITPEEFPVHSQLKLTIITDYFPTWHKKATAPASYESPLYDGTF
ncbi:MAG: type IV secretory system conjugative DNA transfer family protein, partial [Oscillospiraceae bacterium]|nr:type IV secretory system conjugative DNA transfer family protein [Oscillospiraceae bacterium]